MKTIVIIPCRNEAGRIGSVVTAIKQHLPAADVVVINDASTDTSSKEAQTSGAIVLSHCSGLGYGAALETGYMYAIQKNYDVLIQMDGDGQHPADQTPVILAPLEDGNADIVIGSRHLNNLGSQATSPIRTLGHKLFSTIIFMITGKRLSDPTSGFQAMTKKALTLFSSGIFPCDYPDSDVILIAHLSGLRIKEVPVRMEGREGGESMHSGLAPLYYGLKMLFSIFIVLLNYHVWKKWKKTYPEKQDQH